MTDKETPLALRLATLIDCAEYEEDAAMVAYSAADELRRLSALNAELVEALEKLLVFYGGAWCDEAEFASIEAKELLAKAKGESNAD